MCAYVVIPKRSRNGDHRSIVLVRQDWFTIGSKLFYVRVARLTLHDQSISHFQRTLTDSISAFSSINPSVKYARQIYDYSGAVFEITKSIDSHFFTGMAFVIRYSRSSIIFSYVNYNEIASGSFVISH